MIDRGKACQYFLLVYANTLRLDADVFLEQLPFYVDQFRKVLMILPMWGTFLDSLEKHQRLWMDIVFEVSDIGKQGKGKFEVKL